MKKLTISRSLLYYLDELEYTEAALAAHPDTADLAPIFNETITEWDSIFLVQRQARRSVVRAEAMVAMRNMLLDFLTSRFGGQVFLEAGQSYQSPFFRRFFPKVPSLLIKWALRKQCEHTLNVMVPEALKLAEDNPVRLVAAGLRDAAQSALESLSTRTAARAARGITSSDVEDWKEGVNRLRLGTYAELLKRSAEKGYAKSWAEAFFRSASSSTAEDEDDLEVSETPAEPLPAGASPVEPIEDSPDE